MDIYTVSLFYTLFNEVMLIGDDMKVLAIIEVAIIISMIILITPLHWILFENIWFLLISIGIIAVMIVVWKEIMYNLRH